MRTPRARQPGTGAFCSISLCSFSSAQNSGGILTCIELLAGTIAAHWQRRQPTPKRHPALQRIRTRGSKIDAVPPATSRSFSRFSMTGWGILEFLAIIVPRTAADEAGVQRRTDHELSALAHAPGKTLLSAFAWSISEYCEASRHTSGSRFPAAAGWVRACSRRCPSP